MLLFATGCKKSGSGPAADVFPDGVNIYMAGQSNGHIAYWKNGQLVDLGGPGNATGITVAGADVYVSANADTNQVVTAVYWKNSTRFNLAGSRFSNAYGVAVAGSDVYVTGLTAGIPSDTPVYWKNGVEIPLTFSGYFFPAYSIATAGTDVYMAGNGAWQIKNGGPAVPGAGPAADCNAVTVAGTDLYFAGDSAGKPYYWKNGHALELADKPVVLQTTSPLAITVSGTDVYVAGIMPIPNGNGRVHAVYWKNGVLTTLDTKYDSSFAEGIAVVGKDIYIAGYIYDNGKDVPVYWKNGQMVRLGTDGTVVSMVVGS